MSDPEKTKAIVEVEAPKTLKELRRFMGMANQLGKFSPNLAECSQSLRELLSPRKSCVWGSAQEEAFKKVKEELTKPTVLALYNPNAKTKIRADASAYGLGASYCSITRERIGNQLHMLPSPCPSRRNTTPRLRKRPSLLFGPVRSLLTMLLAMSYFQCVCSC